MVDSAFQNDVKRIKPIATPSQLASPVLRQSFVPDKLITTVSKRIGIFCMLVASISTGVSLAIMGTQAADTLEVCLSELRYNSDLDPYR